MKITKQNSRNLEIGTMIFGEPDKIIIGGYDQFHDAYWTEEMDVVNVDECGLGEAVPNGNRTMTQRTDMIGCDSQEP